MKTLRPQQALWDFQPQLLPAEHGFATSWRIWIHDRRSKMQRSMGTRCLHVFILQHNHVRKISRLSIYCIRTYGKYVYLIAFSIMVRTMNWLMFVILLIFDLQLHPERSCRSCTVDATPNRLYSPNVEVAMSYLATGKTTRHSQKHAVSGDETCSSTPWEAGIYIVYYIVTYDSKDTAWSLVYYHI